MKHFQSQLDLADVVVGLRGKKGDDDYGGAGGFGFWGNLVVRFDELRCPFNLKFEEMRKVLKMRRRFFADFLSISLLF